MLPSFVAGDFVLAVKYPLQPYRPNDVILVRHKRFGDMIKRITSISSTQGCVRYHLAGDNIESVTTDAMGEINRAQILGKVFWRITSKNQ